MAHINPTTTTTVTLLPPPLAAKVAAYTRRHSHSSDELSTFRSCLRWMCVDQSTHFSACISWFIFIFLVIVVPGFSHYVVGHRGRYDTVVQASMSSVATVSFVCLTGFMRKYGLRRFLFFDKLVDVSDAVKRNYTIELHRSLRLCLHFVLPCFLLECAYKIWWYASVPSLSASILLATIPCVLELLSWVYRTTVFFLVCILFRLFCFLQILRLQDFATVFSIDSDVQSTLKEHLTIRRHLRIISHRYRPFTMWALVLINISQFMSLLLTTKSYPNVNLFTAGELVLCSITQVTGLMILLRSAIKITHKAQAITCLATKWHVCATLNSFDAPEMDTPVVVGQHIVLPTLEDATDAEAGESLEVEDAGDEEDDVDNTSLLPPYAYSNLSFQNRQALVTYLENNRAGITMYGLVLDRAWLQLILMIEMSLVLWILGKTVGI